MQVIMMDSALLFDSGRYDQFPNYPQMELDYMHFLLKDVKAIPVKEQVSDEFRSNLLVRKFTCCKGNPKGS